MTQQWDAGRLDSDQERYSLLDREREADNLAYCHGQGVAFLAYSPMAQGLLTGRVGPDRTFSGDDIRRDNPRFSQDNRARVARLLEPIQGLAADRGVGVEHVVLAWTLSGPRATHVLVGARDAAQARGNARAGSLELSPQELTVVDCAVADFDGLQV